MADLEKTINDLVEIEANMTFYKHPESAKVVRDAIERLKEQQPRVLTLCEVSNAKYPEDVFCEIKDENRVFAVTAPVPIRWRAKPDIRYWTARPTNEQRKAEPWKDGEQE